jgi:hypothetical protein
MISNDEQILKQKYNKYKTKYLNLKSEHYKNQLAGNFKNKKMLIFTNIEERIYGYEFKDEKEIYTLPSSGDIEKQLKEGITYILYEDVGKLQCISDPPLKEVLINTKLIPIFKPIFDGLTQFSKETCKTYYKTIMNIFEQTGTTRIIGLEITAFKNIFNFSLNREDINDILRGNILIRSTEYLKLGYEVAKKKDYIDDLFEKGYYDEYKQKEKEYNNFKKLVETVGKKLLEIYPIV